MSRYREGFTAVEILITLFIGSLLLLGGYQAYGLVVNNTQDARERAIASNYAYDALRRIEAQFAKSPCQVITEANIPAGILPSSPEVPVHLARYAISCPYGTANNVSKVMTKIRYGAEQKEVVHAIYTKNS